MTLRLAVLHGPGADPRRRGLVTASPGTPERLDGLCRTWAAEVEAEARTAWAGHEQAFVAALEAAVDAGAEALVVVPGELAASAAAAEAIAASQRPAVELHLTNLRDRGQPAGASPVGRACVRTIHGRGIDGYRWAIHHLVWRAAWQPEPVAFGPEHDHVADVRVPAGDARHPVAVLLHGGFWLDAWERDLMDGLAVDLARRGWATWNVEYRRVGSGGGWPETGEDVLAAIGHVREHSEATGLDAGGLVLVGHSAGGQLALWAAASVRPAAVVGLAPVTDLAEAAASGLGGGAVDAFLATAPDPAAALAEASPLVHARRLAELGVAVLFAHAEDDPLVPLEQSRRYFDEAAGTGARQRLIEVPEAGHFGLVDPTHHVWEVVAGHIPGLVAEAAGG